MNSRELIEAALESNAICNNVLSNYILATVREDDDEEVTEPYVITIGGWKTIGRDAVYVHKSAHVSIRFKSGVAMIQMLDGLKLPAIKTRGQLRQLIKLLGAE